MSQVEEDAVRLQAFLEEGTAVATMLPSAIVQAGRSIADGLKDLAEAIRSQEK